MVNKTINYESDFKIREQRKDGTMQAMRVRMSFSIGVLL